MSLQPFDRFWWNLARWRTLVPYSGPTVKISNFWKSKTWKVYHTRRPHVDNSHQVWSWYYHSLPSYNVFVCSYVTWPWPLTFWSLTFTTHGGSRDQPCHQVWTLKMRTAAILFMQSIRWKLKIRLGNRAHRIQHASIMLKSLVPHFYPKMHLDDYWRPLFRNPSSLIRVHTDFLTCRV